MKENLSDDDNSNNKENLNDNFLSLSNIKPKELNNNDEDEKENIFENNDKNEKEIENEKENEDNLDEKDNEEENLKYIKIKNIDKIVCPDCGEISNLEINNNNYIIKSFCPNKHLIEDTIINFINRSEQKLNEEIECFDCKKKTKELNCKQNDMYRCKCGKNICPECKNKHESQKEEKIKNEKEKENEDEDEDEDYDDDEDDEKKHVLVKFSEKDFKCTCTDSVENYYYFCKTCNKNLCNGCDDNHPTDHPTVNFSEIMGQYLLEDKIKEKKDKFKNLKTNINKFLINLYDLKEKLEQKIKLLEKTLNAYLNVNNYILKIYKVGTWNYQTIDNIKNINLNFPELYELFLSLNGEKEKFSMLMSLFEYQNIENKSFITKDSNQDSISSLINLPKSFDNSIDDKINEKIASVCKLKNGIAVGDQKGQIHCFTFTGKKLKEDFIIPDEKGNKIKFLYSLKNGYFISSNINEFKIYEVETKEKIEYKIIQTFKYKNIPHNNNDIAPKNKLIIKPNRNTVLVIAGYYYYQILELINGYLLYIDGDKLIALKPASRGHYIEEPKNEIKFDCNIICLAELNNNKFSVYCEDKNLTIFDSNNFKEKTKISLKEFPIFKKIIGVNSDIIAALEEKKLILISEAKQGKIQDFKIDDFKIYDICNESNKIFLACQNYFIEIVVKANKDGNYLTKTAELPFKFIVNGLYLIKFENELNQKIGRLVCIYNDNNVKIL